MKKMKKILAVAAFAATSLMLSASLSAQTLEKVTEYATLDAVNVMDGAFDVSLVRADAYSIKIVTDAVISDYVTSTVRDQTVYISYDSKSVPKEVKKLYKGRSTPDPVLRVIISAPDIHEVVLGDKSTFSCTEPLRTSRFNLSLLDNASVKALQVSAENIGILLKKKSSAILTLDAGVLTVSTEGNANARISGKYGAVSTASDGSSTLIIEGDCEELELKGNGSSQQTVNSKAGKVTLDLANSSKVALSGSADELTIRGRNNASADIRNCNIDEVTLTLNSSTVHIGAKKKLNLELTSGAEVFYDGDPQFIVKKIIKSTLAPAGSK